VLNQREGGLKKFPYTIPELVSASPAKSSDGYLYTGDKRDQWLAIDRTTGAKLDALTSETLAPKITNQDENVLFLGRTKYTISMFDINTHRKKFNLTYYDYSTHATTINSSFSDQAQKSFYTSSTPSPTSSAKMNSDVFNYPYYHFTSSSDGLLITLDKRNGELVWTLKLTNPIVAIYLHQNEQLYKLNFAIFSIEALTSMQNESGRYKLLFTDQNVAKEILAKSLFTPTLYVGFYGNSLYAMPAFVFNAQIINVDSKLIEGPKNMPEKTQDNTNVDNNVYLL
jgi:serine/threonine-protein kinase/endoribonuclease IRE1